MKPDFFWQHFFPFGIPKENQKNKEKRCWSWLQIDETPCISQKGDISPLAPTALDSVMNLPSLCSPAFSVCNVAYYTAKHAKQSYFNVYLKVRPQPIWTKSSGTLKNKHRRMKLLIQNYYNLKFYKLVLFYHYSFWAIWAAI